MGYRMVSMKLLAAIPQSLVNITAPEKAAPTAAGGIRLPSGSPLSGTGAGWQDLTVVVSYAAIVKYAGRTGWDRGGPPCRRRQPQTMIGRHDRPVEPERPVPPLRSPGEERGSPGGAFPPRSRAGRREADASSTGGPVLIQ